jgi:hypothetical protein
MLSIAFRLFRQLECPVGGGGLERKEKDRQGACVRYAA